MKIMREITKQQKEMIDKAIKYAPMNQILTWMWWEIFSREKSDKLIKCIEDGMHWKAAFTIAKNQTVNP